MAKLKPYDSRPMRESLRRSDVWSDHLKRCKQCSAAENRRKPQGICDEGMRLYLEWLRFDPDKGER